MTKVRAGSLMTPTLNVSGALRKNPSARRRGCTFAVPFSIASPVCQGGAEAADLV